MVNPNTRPEAGYLQSKLAQQFMKVKMEWLRFNRSYDFDLYVYSNEQYVLFCRKHLTLTPSMAAKVQKKAIIYVDKSDAEHFQAYMEENITDIIRDTTRPIAEKSEAVYKVSTSLVDELLAAPKAACITRVKDLVANQLEFVMANPGAVNSLMSITEHDYYTYTHSVNVAIYLVGLGEMMKLTRQEIQYLSLGGMLHDLGKARISLEIINCTTKLTEAQFEEMKKHPRFGIEVLKSVDPDGQMVPRVCYDAILHHHERFNGGGYPFPSMNGKDIPLFGRMTKVCDVFDALTTKRSYKAEMSSFEALTLMRDKMIEEFDPDVFGEFLRMMANYSEDMRKRLNL